GHRHTPTCGPEPRLVPRRRPSHAQGAGHPLPLPPGRRAEHRDQRPDRALARPGGVDVHHPGRVGVAAHHRLVPPPGPVRRAHPRGRQPARDRGRHARRHPDRDGRRHLPVRVRHVQGPSLPEARPRDPRRDPERGARLLRPHVHLARDRRSDRALLQPVQPGRRRHRGRHPHHPPDRLDRRGRHALGAERPAGGVVRDGRPQGDHVGQGRDPRCGVRPGRRLHRRRLPGHRGDDGRLHRRRSQRWRPAQLRPVRPGPDDDRGHGLAGVGHRSGEGGRAHVPEPVLHRDAAVPHHLAAQRLRRPLRPPRAAEVL
ncbi:MAG: Phosphate transport system permease protein PstC, partial [uncultured Acidimicrobiales bacterium]